MAWAVFFAVAFRDTLNTSMICVRRNTTIASIPITLPVTSYNATAMDPPMIPPGRTIELVAAFFIRLPSTPDSHKSESALSADVLPSVFWHRPSKWVMSMVMSARSAETDTRRRIILLTLMPDTPCLFSKKTSRAT